MNNVAHMHMLNSSARKLAVAVVALLCLMAPISPALAVDGLETQSQATANLQQALKDKGFYRGPIDGAYGATTQQAVMAFRKTVGATRSYSWSNSLWDELNNFVKPWSPFRYQEPDRVEINLSRQVMYLYRGGALSGVFPISSGNGQSYTNQFGSFSIASTPTGDFKIQRHIRGERLSYLGTLWNPWYFSGGYALHGSPSVPSGPASHGCVRLTFTDSDWLETRLFVGMPFHVWYEPAGKGPVLAPGGELPTGGPAPCPNGVLCDSVAFQDSAGRFYLWSQINSSPGISPFWFGNPGDIPFSGDWNGDGVKTPGLYRKADGYVYLRNSNTEGVADIAFFFGNPGDLPVAGDFDGDGVDTVSIYRPSEQRFYIINELGSNGEGLGAADYSFLFGNPGDRPLSGDFDGDGTDTIAVHRPSTGRVLMRNENSTGVADLEFIFGNPGDVMIAGDWNGNGFDTISVFRPGNGLFYVKNSNSNGYADSSYDVGFLSGVIAVGP